MSALYFDTKALNAPSYDAPLLWVSMLLLGLGLVMVYSASIAIAGADPALRYNGEHYLNKHLLFMGVALFAAGVAFKIPLHMWQSLSPYLFVLGLVALILVLLVGHAAGGARRWLSLGVIHVQPSELVKLFTVLYVADYVVRKAEKLKSDKLIKLLVQACLPITLVIMLVGGLLLAEPDFGALVVIAAIAGMLLFLAGIRMSIFLGLFSLLTVLVMALVLSEAYRLTRIVGFLDPWADPFGKGYQLTHALIAFGRGEWMGLGLGASIEKLSYLPEAHTDFILAVIAEELGLLGVGVVILMLMWLVWRAFLIGMRAHQYERYFAGFVAQGIGVWLGVQSIINCGVNMGLLPTKGLTLPFLSFGGSSMVLTCVAMAILLRIDRDNRYLSRGGVL